MKGGCQQVCPCASCQGIPAPGGAPVGARDGTRAQTPGGDGAALGDSHWGLFLGKVCSHKGWLLTLPLHPCRCQTFPALSGAFSCILCVRAVPGGLGCVAAPNWWQEGAEIPPWCSGLPLPVGLP